MKVVALIQRYQGRFPEAIVNLKSAIDLSPQNADYSFDLGHTYMISRKYSQAELYLERSISLAADQVLAHGMKANNYILWKGDLEKSRSTLERMPQKKEAISISLWYFQEISERNYPAALARLSSLSTDIINLMMQGDE